MKAWIRRTCALLTLVGVLIELAMIAFDGDQNVGVLVGLGAVVTGGLAWKLDDSVQKGQL